MGLIAEVGSAFVTLMPSAKGFGRATEKQVGGEMTTSGRSIGSKFGGMVKVGAAAAVGGAVLLGGFLKGSIEEAREAQKVGALTNAVIKSTGGVANVTAGQVDSLATSISNKTGIDDEAIAAGQNMLLTFTNVRNEVGKGNDIFNRATVTATDMAAAFGGDAVSNSKILGKALNDPIRGVSALTRVGVSFTDQQKKQITTLQESGNVLGAQKLILGELAKQTRGAAASQATAGQKFATTWNNFKEAVGTALLPLLDRLLGALTPIFVTLSSKVGPAFARVGAVIRTVSGVVKGVFASFQGGGASTGPLVSAFGRLKAAAAAFAPTIQRAVAVFKAQFLPILRAVATYILTKVAPAAIRLAATAANNLRPAFNAIIPVVAKVLAKLREWGPTIAKVIGFIGRMIAFSVKLTTAFNGKLVPALIKVASSLAGKLIQAISVTISMIGKIIRACASFNKALVNAGQAVVRFAGAVKSGIAAVAKSFASGVQAAGKFASAVKDKAGDVVQAVGTIPGKAKAALGNLGGLLVSAGQALVQGLINGITSRISALVSKMSELASKVKGFLPGSPVKTGPLKTWNRGGGPGAALVDRIASGLGDTSGVDAAMGRLTSRITVPTTAATLHTTGVGTGAGSGGVAVFHLYDVNDQIIGTMRGEAKASVTAGRTNDAMRRRAR